MLITPGCCATQAYWGPHGILRQGLAAGLHPLVPPGTGQPGTWVAQAQGTPLGTEKVYGQALTWACCGPVWAGLMAGQDKVVGSCRLALLRSCWNWGWWPWAAVSAGALGSVRISGMVMTQAHGSVLSWFLLNLSFLCKCNSQCLFDDTIQNFDQNENISYKRLFKIYIFHYTPLKTENWNISTNSTPDFKNWDESISSKDTSVIFL